MFERPFRADTVRRVASRLREAAAPLRVLRSRLWNGLARTLFLRPARLFLIVVLVTAGYSMWVAWSAWELVATASATTTWPINRTLNDATVRVRTNCRDSRLSYLVVIVPAPGRASLTVAQRADVAKVGTDKLRQRLKTITVHLVDKDGLSTMAFDVAIDDFVRMFSSSEERPVSLEARGTLPCSPAVYVRTRRVMLSWTLQP